MAAPLRSKLAMDRAQALVRELGISSLPVDPFAIALKKDIVVQAKPDSDEGVSGMLLRHGNNFGILYATHIPSEGFQRFSVAHELGHYCLPGHIDHVLRDGVHSSRAGFVSGDRYELEADQFAAGLLMPATLFRRAMEEEDPGLSAIEALAGLCRTSLTATAIRYAELSRDAIGVIVSTGSRVDYCWLSATMSSLQEFSWPTKGSAVPRGTATSEFTSRAERISRAEREEEEVDIQDWLGGERSISATEEVVGLGAYGKTLTILTCSKLVEDTYKDTDQDEEDESELIERWTPRFRR